jgi:hypothetical protein
MTPRADPEAPDFSKLPPLQQQMLLSARRGADWLFRMNGVKGRFLYGALPALDVRMEGDHYLRQATAAFALARAARLTGEERYAVRATQAVLALLDETAVDAKEPLVRSVTLPAGVVNRLGAAGLLILAINELPAPQSDLLDKSEQLCQYVRRQARPDGSLRGNEAPPHPTLSPDNRGRGKGEGANAEAVSPYAGMALYGLMRSQKHRPAAWKLELARKALAYHRVLWKEHKHPECAAWRTAAFAEAFLLTKERDFADFVNVMADWLCTLQYDDQVDPRRLAWMGGFRGWADGRATETVPQIESAVYAEGVAQACRVARELGDLSHHDRFRPALERCLQFLATLQYVEANTQHYADWYRPRLVGAFHASHQDGNLRIDYTAHAVSALVLYLEQVAR